MSHLSILDFGGVGDGITDNTLAFNNAVAALPARGGGVYIPGGLKFKFNSALTVNYPATPGYSFSLVGDGAEESVMFWNGTDGLTINGNLASHSVHAKDLTLTTGAMGTNKALTLTNSALLGVFEQNDVQRVTFRGDDGGGLTDYWGTGINVVGLSNINLDGSLFYGNAAGNGGSGVKLAGNAAINPYYGVVYNFGKCGFYNLGIGLDYGTYIQGVTASQCNFVNGTTGIYVSPGGTGAAQLDVGSCNFNVTGNQVIVGSALASLNFHNNLVYIPKNTVGLWFNAAGGQHFIGGNIFTGTSNIGSTGILFGFANGPTAIAPNVFNNLATGMNLAGTSGLVVSRQSYAGVATQIANPGSNVIL